MITHRQIRTAMKARLEAIPDIGRVHEYERWSKRMDKLRDWYSWNHDQSGEQLRGWFIRRPGNVDLWGATSCVTRVEDWEIRGFMALSDEEATELDFDDLVGAVMSDFFNAGAILPGARLVSNDAGSEVRLIQAIPVMFAGVLCHSAVIGLRVEVTA